MFAHAKKLHCLLISLFVLSFIIVGCSSSQPKTRKPQSKLDTPEHHVLRANDMIERNRWDAARREYQLALDITPSYSPALAGKSLVLAHDATLPGKTNEEIAKIQEDSLAALDRAESNASTPTETAQYHVMAIRVQSTLKQEENWLETAEDHFNDAQELYNEDPKLFNFRAEPHFYMARAYRDALSWQKAMTQYGIVLDLNLSFTRLASLELEQIQKTVRANPGTRQGAKIANSPFITRGDLAALLIEELRLSQLYGRSGDKKRFDNSFKAPKSAGNRLNASRNIPEVTDIDSHPLRSDIEEVMKIGVRGLGASPQRLFNPDQKVKRAEFALILEDILIQVTKDRSLSTRFIGESSPWPDVRPSAFYYNAARTMISRNIMTVIDRTRGEFGPNQSITGTDALLGIRTLKDELQNYIRNPQS